MPLTRGIVARSGRRSGDHLGDLRRREALVRGIAVVDGVDDIRASRQNQARGLQLRHAADERDGANQARLSKKLTVPVGVPVPGTTSATVAV